MVTSHTGPRVGPIELRVLQTLDRSRQPVWRVGDAIPAGLTKTQLNQSLHYLTEAGLLERIERGTYLVTPRSGRTLVDPLELVGSWFAAEPHVVVGHAAAEYHRLTLDTSSAVEVQLARKKLPLEFQGIRYVFSTAPLSRLKADNIRAQKGAVTITIASPGKLVIQLLDATGTRRSSRATRGTGLVLEILQTGSQRGTWRAVDWPRLVKRHGNASTARRLGFLLERLGIPGSDGLMPLSGKSGFIRLSPLYPDLGPIDTRWRLLINDPVVG